MYPPLQNLRLRPRRLRRGIRLALGLLLATACPAAAEWQYFRQYTSVDGLSQSVVQALYQDRMGYLWVGTQAGLNRYDGESFTVFSIQDGLANDWINDIAQGPDGALWVATLDGVSSWDGSEFTNLTIANGPVRLAVQSLVVDALGVLWCATARGVSRYDGESWRTYTETHGLPAAKVGPLLLADDGRLWAGTARGLAYRAGDRFVAFEAGDLGRGEVGALSQDGQGRLWVGVEKRLLVFDEGRQSHRFTEQDGLLYSSVLALQADRFGAVWAGTSRGLSVMNPGDSGEPRGVRTYGIGEGLEHPNVRSLLVDREGVVWIGALGGLQKLQGRAFTNYGVADGLGSNQTRPIVRDGQGTLWVGTEGGLSRLVDGRWTNFTETHGLPHRGILSLLTDRQGELWIGTRSGLSRFHGGGFVTDPTLPPGLPVASIVETPEGRIWAATQNGDAIYNRVAGRFEPVRVQGQSFSNPRLLADRAGRVWFSGDQGLSCLDNGQWKTYTTRDGLADDHPYFLVEDHAGVIWFGYHSSHGLTSFDGNEFKTYTTEQGLSNNAVYSLGVDSKNHLWIGTANGVDRFDGETFHGYGTREGYAHNESNAGGFFADSDQTLWFGTMGGLSHYNPRYDVGDEEPPTVRLAALALGGVTFPSGLEPRVLAEQNELRAHVAVLSFTHEQRLDVQYRLLGLSPRWSTLEGRDIYVPNLLPARYSLEVRARKYRAPWSETARFHFSIAPPFWRTAWFWGLSLAAALACLYGGYRLKTSRMRRQAQVLEHKVDERTQELAKKTEELESFIYTVSHDLKAPVISLQGLASMLEGELGDQLSADASRYLERIHANTDHMRQLIHDLLELSRIGRLREQRTVVPMGDLVGEVLDELQGQIDPKGATVQVAAELPAVECEPTRLREVWINLITNALNHCEPHRPPTIEIGWRRGKKSHHFFVRDNGIGVAPDQKQRIFEIFYRGQGKYDDSESTGVGLAIVKRIIATHGGRVWVDSPGPGRGSTFWFTLPESTPGVSRRRSPWRGAAQSPAPSSGAADPRRVTGGSGLVPEARSESAGAGAHSHPGER